MKHLRKFETKESIIKFGNFVNERRENALDYRDFIREVERRVVDVDKDGNPRNEEGKLYWQRAVDRYEEGHPSYIMSPMNLLHRAYLSGLYELDDINDQSLGRASEVIGYASDGMEGHGFGSSDFTFLLKSFLEADGIKAGFIDGFLRRLTDEQAEVLDAQKSIPWLMSHGIGNYNDEYKAKYRKLGDALVNKGLAVETGKRDGRGKGENEYALTEEGEKLNKLELAEAATDKKLKG
jgi:hypothetical protein